MDMKLDGLIEKIKSEGVNEAKKKSNELINIAKEEALVIKKKAQEEAENIIKVAQGESDKLRANAESALKQSERDTILTIKEQLTNLFNNVFKIEISKTLSVDFLKQLILKMVENTAKGQDLNVLVTEQDIEKLKNLVLDQSKKSLTNNVTFKVDKGISSGFRIGLKGDDVYYDFTDQSISEFLREFLNPGINEILSK